MINMNKDEAIELQTKMAEAGFYEGKIDGIWGPKSEAAYTAFTASLEGTSNLDIAWSAKVSKEFVERVKAMCERLKMEADGPNCMMSCMAWESGETFSSNIKNGAGSGAVGLIQFMPKTAKSLGTTVEALAAMRPEDQLDYVEKYFKPYKGKLKTLSDIYMAILWPKAIGKAEDYVMFDKAETPTTYRQNSGVDINADGKCTKAEAAAKVMQKYRKGMQAKNRRIIE